MRWYKYFIIVLLVVAVVAIVAIFWPKNNASSPFGGNVSQLTGLQVTADEASRPILAVVVENSPPARPQTGLGSAGIIYETVTEGGITRYLAFYQEHLPETVGPVRSLRPYFVDWTMGYDAAVAHVGGSPQAIEMAKQLHIKDLDQFKYPAPYYRSSSRQAPHNVYVKMDKLLAQAQELGFGTSNFVGYPRKDDNPVTNPSATDIIVNYSSQDYQGEFRYQASSNTYIRYLAAQQQVDQATGQPIQIKNVVVIKMSGQQVNANSSGDAVVFYDGRAIQANWQKDSHSDYLHVYDSNGNALQLNRGSTWFAVLPKGQVLTY